MIRQVNLDMDEYRGKSTDTKPSGIANGTTFLEIDTGAKYMYDEENEQWCIMPSGSGGGENTEVISARTGADGTRYGSLKGRLDAENEDLNDKIDGDISLLKSHLGAVEIVDTASGAIATFADGSDGVPVESLTVTMEPIQDLHGQDAPYPAGGGANKFNPESILSGTYNAATNVWSNTNPSGKAFDFTFAADTQYTFSGKTKQSVASKNLRLQIVYTDASTKNIWASNDTAEETFSVTSEAGKTIDYIAWKYGSVGGAVDVSLFQIEVGTTATAFAPYSNICPISGRQSVTVTRAGKNLFDVTDYNGLDAFLDQGQIKPSQGRLVVYIPCLPNTAYTVSRNAVVTAERFAVAYTTVAPAIGVSIYGQTSASASQTIGAKMSITITTGADAAYLVVWAYWTNTTSALDTLQIELGSTATAYEPGTIQSVSIPLGQTVYGGTVDVTTGVLTVGYGYIDLGTLNWTKYGSNPTDGRFISSQPVPYPKTNGNGACSAYSFGIASIPNLGRNLTIGVTSSKQFLICDKSYTDSSLLKTALSGVYVAYEINGPVTVQLTAQQMTTLLGLNNVWSDGGDVSVDYVADTKLFIEQLTEPDADMIADANITSGQYFMVGNQLYLATVNIASGAAISHGVNCTRTNLAAALNAINA